MPHRNSGGATRMSDSPSVDAEAVCSSEECWRSAQRWIELPAPLCAEHMIQMAVVLKKVYGVFLDAGVERVPTRGPKLPEKLNSLEGIHVVYYLQFGDRIKIGTSRNLKERLKSIPHDKMLAVELGGIPTESKRHQQFQKWGLTGEWFEMAPPLMAHIAELQRLNPGLRSGLPNSVLRSCVRAVRP